MDYSFLHADNRLEAYYSYQMTNKFARIYIFYIALRLSIA